MVQTALERWIMVKSELGTGHERLDRETLRQFWRTVLPILLGGEHRGAFPESDPQVLQLVAAARSGRGLAGEGEWRALSRLVPGIPNLGDMLRRNREERVRALELYSDVIARSPAATPHVEMLLGYISAQVGEGSLNYLPLVYRVADQFPAAVLWFGFFAGLNRNNDILVAGDCLGRRLGRKVTPRNLGLPPIVSDLSYEELLLFLHDGRMGKIRTDLQSIIEVELVPGVVGRYRLARANKRDDDPQRSTAALDAARKLAAQLQSVLRSADGPVEEKTRSELLFGQKALEEAKRSGSVKPSNRRKPYGKSYK
jgi:hypothetical protein